MLFAPCGVLYFSKGTRRWAACLVRQNGKMFCTRKFGERRSGDRFSGKGIVPFVQNNAKILINVN